MPFCRSCGASVLEEDVFCGKCGARLKPTAELDGGDTEPLAAPLEPTPRPKAVPPPPPQVSPSPPSPPLPPLASPPPQPSQPEQPRAQANPRARGRGGLTFFGVIVAVGWLFYSSGMMGVLAGAYYFDPNLLVQQADWISFGLMIGLPLGISLLRPALDILLIPLQPVRFRIPGKMLVGMGLVAPFAVSWVLYDAWGFRNYEFLHYSLIFGTLISYAILRTPARYSA